MGSVTTTGYKHHQRARSGETILLQEAEEDTKHLLLCASTGDCSV